LVITYGFCSYIVSIFFVVCIVEDDEDDTNIDISYRPIHIVPIHDNFSRMVIEEVKDGNTDILVPTSEVKVVG